MTTFLLDTSVLVELRKPRPQSAVVEWIAFQDHHDVSIAAITAGELQIAIERARRANAPRAEEMEAWLVGLCRSIQVLAADDAVFRIWAQLMERKPTPIATDALIAATALHHDLTIAARDVRRFAPFGVLVANPFGRGR